MPNDKAELIKGVSYRMDLSSLNYEKIKKGNKTLPFENLGEQTTMNFHMPIEAALGGSRVRCGSQTGQGVAPMALEEHSQDHRHRI